MTMDRIDQIRNFFKIGNIPLIVCISLQLFIVIQLFAYHSESNLDKCFLSIENFVTVRYQNTTERNATFDMKTFAHSYTSPYLIELITNSKNDCLCCN